MRKNVTHNGLVTPGSTKLSVVNELRIREQVFENEGLDLGTSAEASVIVWDRQTNMRRVAAEFSFRYEHKDDLTCEVASTAMRFFEAIQKLQPDGAHENSVRLRRHQDGIVKETGGRPRRLTGVLPESLTQAKDEKGGSRCDCRLRSRRGLSARQGSA